LPRNRKHYHVTLEDVLLAHEGALLYGGVEGIRDIGLILSAIGRPYLGYYRSIAEKAAALVHSLALNHGFIDGNKRTALLVLALFVERSGYSFKVTSEEALNVDIENIILGIVEHRMEIVELTRWMKDRLI
jgi:death-on-curing protein